MTDQPAEMPTSDNVIPIQPEPVKPTLRDKEETCKQISQIHTLLAEGLFLGAKSQRLSQSRQFLEMIHQQALLNLQADPEYKKEVESAKTQEPKA